MSMFRSASTSPPKQKQKTSKQTNNQTSFKGSLIGITYEKFCTEAIL